VAAFEYILMLLSFVYALALAHVLTRVGLLMVARRRVLFSGLQALAVVNAVAQVYNSWLIMWIFHDQKDWDIASTTTFLIYACVNYFVCVAAAPDIEPRGTIDLDAFYWSNRLIYWGLFTALMVLAMLANIVVLKASNVSMFIQLSVTTLPYFAPCILTLAVRARWAQWVGGLTLLAFNVVWTVFFSGDLR
jgi:hypothetical protein